MDLFPFSYAHAYANAYVTPVRTYFSYFSDAYVYGCAYAYVKVWTNLTDVSIAFAFVVFLNAVITKTCGALINTGKRFHNERLSRRL